MLPNGLFFSPVLWAQVLINALIAEVVPGGTFPISRQTRH